MRTSSWVSTISYNTPKYLKLVLNQLMDLEIVSFWTFVCHLKEDDELKDHIHLLIHPNTCYSTMKLQSKLQEPDPDYPKPRGCIDFRKSDCDEWLLYCSHYPPYLKSIGQQRKYEYPVSEFFQSSCEDTLNEMWLHALRESNWAVKFELTKQLRESTDPIDLINTGRIPLAQAGALVAYERLKAETNRNGRKSHTPLKNVK